MTRPRALVNFRGSRAGVGPTGITSVCSAPSDGGQAAMYAQAASDGTSVLIEANLQPGQPPRRLHRSDPVAFRDRCTVSLIRSGSHAGT